MDSVEVLLEAITCPKVTANVTVSVLGKPRLNKSDEKTNSDEVLGKPRAICAAEPRVAVELALTGKSTGPTIGLKAIR